MNISIVRRVLHATFVILVATVLVLALGGRLAPVAGHHLFAVRSGSMTPGIPVGALVVADQGRPTEIADVISMRLPNGVVLTHRVVDIVVGPDGTRLFQTKGDANGTVDPALVPEQWIIGGVWLSIPVLGYVLAMLALPSGIAALLSILGALLTAIWLLEELEEERSEFSHPAMSTPPGA